MTGELIVIIMIIIIMCLFIIITIIIIISITISRALFPVGPHESLQKRPMVAAVSEEMPNAAPRYLNDNT